MFSFAGMMGMKALVKSLNRDRDGHHMVMSRKCYLCDIVPNRFDSKVTYYSKRLLGQEDVGTWVTLASNQSVIMGYPLI